MHNSLKSFILLAASLFPAVTGQAAQDDSAPSIEKLLEKYRMESEAARAALAPKVQEHLLELKELTSRTRSTGSTSKVRADLVKLGSEIVPILVRQLDPGTSRNSNFRFASEVSLVLMELNLAAGIEPLLKMTQSGSLKGKELAVRVLGASKSPERVNEALIQLYTESKTLSRVELLTAIAKLASDEGLIFVTERMRSSDVSEAKSAIAALTASSAGGATSSAKSAARALLDLTRSPSDAAKCITEICDYYKACPSAFDREHASALLSLTESKRLSIEDRLSLLDTLIANEKHWPSDAKKTLRQMAETGNMKLREAVLIGLALSGDNGAKNDLIRRYQEKRKEQPFSSDGFIDLADIQYKVHEYRDAKANYERALGLGRVYTASRRRQVYLGLARCYALEKKYKDAEKWLKTGMSTSQILELAEDPAFARMREHTKYGEIFREKSSD